MDGEIVEKESTDRYSYSKLSSYEHCPYGYYLNYKLTEQEKEACGYLAEGNYYAENGSLVHDIHAKYFSDELPIDDLASYYIEQYDNEICYKVRESIMKKTFECCADYFATVDFEWMKGYKIIGIELKVELEICVYKFIGFIDLLLENEETGEIWLIDHKSSAYPFKKDGGVLAKSKESFESYKKQMYLYCHAVKEIYGKLPTKISWNHFKESKIATIQFNQQEYEESLKWFEETIHTIEKDENFEPKLDFFYCSNLCDYRNSCEYRIYKSEV